LITSGGFDHAQQAAERVKRYASGARAAARRGVRRARAVAAPQVERAGHALADSVAPKVSAMLSSAAQRLEPPKPRRRRWRKLAGISLVTAAGVVAAVVRNRARPDLTAPEETDAGSAAPAAEMRDEKPRTSTSTSTRTSAGADADADVDVDVDGQVRTS
jgi:hypothetical protein